MEVTDVDVGLKLALNKTTTVQDFPIPYPAVGVSPIDYPQNVTYPSSVEAGKDSAISFMQQTHVTCPATVFVLSGWSQGADVIASTLAELASYPNLATRVAGAALFGDPLWNPDSVSAVGGSSLLDGIYGARPEFPADLAAKTQSYCRSGDGVCNYTPTAFAKFALGSGPHFEYVTPGTETEQAASYLAGQIERRDLTVAVDPPAGAAIAGGTASFAVRMRNAGTTTAPPATVYISPGGRTRGLTSLTGSGWACDLQAYLCTTTASAAPGATWPTITAVGGVDWQPGSTLSLTATLTADNGTVDTNSVNDQASASVPVVAGPVDLAVAVDAPSGAAPAGGTASFGVRIRNAGSVKTSPAKVYLSPGGRTTGLTSLTGSGWTCDLQAYLCTTTASVAPGASLPTITATSGVDSQPGWVLSLTAYLTADNGRPDSNSDNDQASSTIPVGAAPVDLAVAVDPPAGAATAGGTASFAVRVRNSGTANASPVKLYLSPGGQTTGLTSSSGSGWVCDLQAYTCTTTATVAPGASLPTITVTGGVASQPGSTLSLTATLTSDNGRPDSNSANDQAISSIPVVPGPVDLAVAVDPPSTAAVAGGSSSFAVRVRNSGTANASPVKVYLSPGGNTRGLTALTGSGWTCDLQAYSCTTTASVAPGSSLPTITAANGVASQPGGNLTLTATLTADNGHPDTNADNDQASAGIPVKATAARDLVVTVAAAGAPFVVSSTGAVTATVRNLGTSATTGTTTVSYGGLGDTATGSGWTCDSSQAVCTRSTSIAAGASAPAITITTIPNGLYGGAVSVTVANSSDGDHSNDTGSISVSTRRGGVDAMVTVVAAGAPFVVSSTGAVTATVRNLGTSATTGSTTVSYGGLGDTATGSGWTCDSSQAVCTRSTSIAAGASAPVITITTIPNGLYGGTASATVTNASDSDHSNDTGSISVTTRRGGVDTVVTVAAAGAPFVVSSTGAVTATVRNLGTSATTGTTTVSYGGLGDTATGSGWTCDSSQAVCTRSTSIAAGASAPAITITTVPNGLYGGTTSATVTNPSDSDHSNDTSSVYVSTRRGGVDTVVTLAAAGAPFLIGAATASYVATVRNAGAAATTGATTVTFGGPFASASGTGWTCDSNAGSCTRSTAIAAGTAAPAITVVMGELSRYGASVSGNLLNASDADHSNDTGSLALASVLR